jgi:hypothetical protein
MAPNVNPDDILEVPTSGNFSDVVDTDKIVDTEAPEQGLATSKLSSSSKSLEVTQSEKIENTRTNPFVVVVAIAAALGGMVFGYDIGGAGTLNPDRLNIINKREFFSDSSHGWHSSHIAFYSHPMA